MDIGMLVSAELEFIVGSRICLATVVLRSCHPFILLPKSGTPSSEWSVVHVI